MSKVKPSESKYHSLVENVELERLMGLDRAVTLLNRRFPNSVWIEYNGNFTTEELKLFQDVLDFTKIR